MDGGNDGPSLRTRATAGLNAAVWALPLPQRLTRLLSQVVYRNPPMPAERVAATVAGFDRAGVAAVVVGGWGVDALHGEELRAHRDADFLIEVGALPRARRALGELGYRLWNANPAPGALGAVDLAHAESWRDPAMRVVELHCSEASPDELVIGSIEGRRVHCMPAEDQLQAQRMRSGREWTRLKRQQRRRNLAALELFLSRCRNLPAIDSGAPAG